MKALIFFSLLFLTACGFTPIYKKTGEQENVTTALNQISIAIIRDREGQFLRNALIDRFYKTGYPANPRYHLVVDTIRERILDFDITVDSEATRRQLTLSTTFSLIDKQTKKNLLRRAVTATTSNNVLESEFSTIVTEQAAREAALNDLSRQIERHISLYFAK